MFRSEDQKRQETAAAARNSCSKCGGTGTVGIGGRGATTSSKCGACNGTGQV